MQSLKRKAAFTALSRVLNTISSFFTQLLLTPLIVSGLGQYLFGVYSLINKTEGYMTFVDLRPSAILRYKLAFLQGSPDLTEKRKFVGASIYLSAITFPIILLVGAILCFFFPIIFKVANEYIPISRAAVIFVAVFLGLKSFLGIPEAILRGNNVEYKGIFIEPARNLLYIILVIATLHMDYGLLGILFASFASFLIAFILRLVIQVKVLPGYSPIKPEKKHIAEVSTRGGWYLFSSFSFQLMQSLDVIIIGLYFSPVSVTVFTLTKALSFRVSESIVTVSGSISSGIGNLVGNAEIEKLQKIRAQLFRFNILIGLILFAYFSVYNAAFIKLWVGVANYSGYDVNLMICLTVPFIILSMSSQLFIDAFLKFKEKSKAIFTSSMVSIVFAVVLANFLGLIGIAVAILIGRVVLLLQFEYLINKELPWTWNFKNFKNVNFSLLLFVTIVITGTFYFGEIEAKNWFYFVLKSVYFFVSIAFFAYILVLTKSEKGFALGKIKGLFNKLGI